MDATPEAGKPQPGGGANYSRNPIACDKAAAVSSRTSTASSSRCRACGAMLAGGRHGSACPRCHPEEAAIAAQLELTFSAQPVLPVRKEPQAPAFIAKPRSSPETKPGAAPDSRSTPAEVPPGPAPSAPRPSGAARFLSIAGGVVIVFGGLSWAGYQMWPRGPVEQSIVQAIAELPRFIERTGAANPLHPLAVESESSPTFADLDGDGVSDLITGSHEGNIHVVRNTGTRRKPRFTQPIAEPYGLVPTDTSNAIAFADLHARRFCDALNAGTNGALTFFENRGSARRPDFLLLSPEEDPFAMTVGPARSLDWRPTFADLDHDGDLDLIVGTRDGTVLYFENRGTPKKPAFQGVTRLSPFGLRGLGGLVSLSFGDVDGDGDLDAVAGNAAGDLRYLENRGNAWRPQFALTPRGTLGLATASRDATVALVDLDGDGDLDCVTGGADGRFRFFENVSAPPAPPTLEAKR